MRVETQGRANLKETSEGTAIVADANERTCPACAGIELAAFIERYGKYQLFECPGCHLQFWSPRALPDAGWYEQMYGGRDEKILPLEPGHRYFLKDARAPRGGALLDIGCGTGNFMAAARQAGYQVTGTELDRNAARFAREKLGLERVLPMKIAEYAAQQPVQRFDVVSFFEVLEHQSSPTEFLANVKSCLKPRGYVALSVPNRDRWQTGPDAFDYPPNHFLRWNVTALKNFLTSQGLEIISVEEEPAGIPYTAQMINMALRTGVMKSAATEASTSFRDLMQMAPERAAQVIQARPTLLEQVFRLLSRIKSAACFPAALGVWPYVRMREYKGAYLYCLARLKK